MKTYLELKHYNETGYINFYSEKIDTPPTLDIDTLNNLEKLLDKINHDIENYRVIIIKSNSSKYFIVGANLDAIKKINKDSIFEWVRRGHEVFNKLASLPIPVIAKVNGYALGGGLELALACDLIAATDKSLFGQPETSLGFVPGWGGSIRLKKRIGISKAKEMFFTGRIISAKEAFKIGLCDFTGSVKDVDEYLNGLISKIKGNSKKAISMVKKLIDDIDNGNYDSTDYYKEALASSICIESEDTQKRLKDFFNKKHKSS